MQPFAAAVKMASGIAVQAVGMIVDPHQAEAIVADDSADCVALARGCLDDPRWAWHAADMLGADVEYPRQYRRAPPPISGRVPHLRVRIALRNGGAPG
jgi:2,4-dienoyl-CoA reductase-like NADH-dependent reductase (Old Yellow Enzyme family)